MTEVTHRRTDARRNHERVVAAARELFARHGLRVTVPEVAAHAGVGRATVYRSYPTKDDLVLAIAKDSFADLAAWTRTAVDTRTPLSAYVPELFARLARDRGLAEAFLDARLVPAADLLHLISGLVDTAKAAGEARTDLSALDLRVLLCGPARQLVALDEWDPDLWRRHGAMVVNALR
ncbi:TetR/AcrR family transcriptional regulator [Asanoa iriomotensis]|uniref:Transcriptional regulator, TetR family protein n=1 Tax=Asanoa iriomotensis TaxID=234613 RepID=A0ABQ4BV98_9ACTN|nr:TetR/AcrR family transcriptional regulator [Asanoa iriomotensis]GIF54448.1 putative transcriptional regulator, TetR family protein [Asanoa iriomotensis]